MSISEYEFWGYSTAPETFAELKERIELESAAWDSHQTEICTEADNGQKKETGRG